jgi:hypothetical protein
MFRSKLLQIMSYHPKPKRTTRHQQMLRAKTLEIQMEDVTNVCTTIDARKFYLKFFTILNLH